MNKINVGRDVSPSDLVKELDRLKAARAESDEKELAKGVLESVNAMTPGGFHPSNHPLRGVVVMVVKVWVVLVLVLVVIGLCVHNAKSSEIPVQSSLGADL